MNDKSNKVLILFDFDESLCEHANTDYWITRTIHPHLAQWQRDQYTERTQLGDFHFTRLMGDVINRCFTEEEIGFRSWRDVRQVFARGVQSGDLLLSANLLGSLRQARCQNSLYANTVPFDENNSSGDSSSVHVKIVSDANCAFIRWILEDHVAMDLFDEIVSHSVQLDDARVPIFDIVPLFPDDLTCVSCPHKCPPQLCKGTVLLQLCKGDTFVVDNIESTAAVAATTASMSATNLAQMQQLVDVHTVYDKIIYVGDGFNDYCPAALMRPGDLVLSREGKRLSALLQKSPVRARVVTWNTGDQLAQLIRQELNER